MRNIWRNSILVLICSILLSCGGFVRLNEFDLAKGYEVTGLRYEMNLSFLSLNDSLSLLSVLIDPNDLLFAKTESGQYIARYSIGYKVFDGYNNKAPLDTTTIHYTLKQTPNTNQKLHKIKIYAPIGKNYVVKASLMDENRNFTASKIKTHRKKSKIDRSYYSIKSLTKGVINYTDYQKDSFSISPKLKNKTPIKVMKFTYKSTCAAKPHEVTYSYRFGGVPDTSWFIGGSDEYKFPPLKNGYYHFITDTFTKEGFSVFSVPESFPKLNSIKQANGALGYLLNKAQYVDLLREKNPRKAFENEWLNLAGNRERARNLIKDYYSEVSIANELFTCNQPGWSTDRGMVYIVYGPPKIVYRYENSEIWIYGEENNLLSEQFEFTKINTDIADNVYELKRNINFKLSFNRMVNAWVDERGY